MTEEDTTAAAAYTPVEEFTITDLETLKVIADSLRLNIVQCLRKPATVKQVAEKINKPPTKLYYHFNLLEKHGLIQMVETRLVSGIVEKHYQASARNYRLERGLLSPGTAEFDENLEVTLSSFFGIMREDLRDSMISGAIEMSEDAPRHRQVMMTQGRLSLTPEQASAFYERLSALIEEFGDQEDEGTLNYKLALMLHPLGEE